MPDASATRRSGRLTSTGSPRGTRPSASAVGSIRSAWRAVVALVSGALGLLLSLASADVWGGYVWLLVLVVVPMVLSLGLRSLLPRLLRKVIGPGLI